MMDLSTAPQENRIRRKLLLVEDDSSVVASLRITLGSDYEIHSAATVRLGVDLFKRVEPSLVLLDLRLADGDGLDVLRQIRLVSTTAPVIVLTGYATMQSVEESLRLGASDFLHKPFDGATLKSRIDRLTAPPTPSSRPADKVLQGLATTLPAIAELERQAHASAMFLHDAANPVMTALGAAQYVCQSIETEPERFDPEMREMAALLQRSMGFVAGMFEHHHPEEIFGALEQVEVSVERVVKLAVEMARAKTKERKVELTVQMLNPEAKVRVNQFALARVLLNLLRNAIYAVEPQTGRVRLTVNSAREIVEFSVQDNGPGIDPNLMDRVFEPHFSTRPDGTGMGLYICKHLVERIGGTLTVHNVPGTGCRFSVGIPRVL